MLKAILHRKYLHVFPGTYELQDSGALYRDLEDLLTSSVFGNLLYLPSDLMWRIVWGAATFESDTDALDGRALPVASGEVKSAEFWPSWWLTQGKEWHRVEPDVFLIYEDFDVIIEAKRYDGQQMQDPIQLAKELAAYHQKQRQGSLKPVYVLAVGGTQKANRVAAETLHRDTTEQMSVLFGTTLAGLHFRVYIVPWFLILRAIKKILGSEALQRHHIAILNDVLAVLELHQVIDWEPTWLFDLAACINKFHLAVSELTRAKWMKVFGIASSSDCKEIGADWWRTSQARRPISRKSLSVFGWLTTGGIQ